MIFSFLKYKSPIWYYNLRPKNDYAYFPTPEQLADSGFTGKLDTNYTSQEAQKRDLAFRAFQSGFIAKDPQNGIDVWENVKLPIEDEYRFMFKNYSKIWVLYILLIRLISLKNPFIEIQGFLKAKGAKRIAHYHHHLTYPEFEPFESALLQSSPLISIIIPTLNRYDYLKEVLKDYQKQTYTHFELVIIDQSDDFNPSFYENWGLNIKLIRQEEKALWKARNQAIKNSTSDYILMSEDDVRIPENYIENHIKVLDFFGADASCGVFFPEGSSIPKERSYFKYGEQFATGNALVKKEVFHKVGLYDRQFEKQRMGDGEFGLRTYLNGFKLVSNPLAYCVDVKAPSGGLRMSGGSWDAWRPKKWNDPRPVPSVLYLSRKYFGSRRSLLFIVTAMGPSIIPYQFKRNKLLKLISIFLIPFIFPFLLFQVRKSWKLATQKLKEGAKIEQL